MEPRISIITIAVDDLDRMAAFYEAMGLVRHRIRDGVAFSDVWSRFDSEGRLLDADRAEQAMATMLAQLHWWASALRSARQSVPYGQFAPA